MATITAKITISSSDLTSDVLSLSKTFNLTSTAGAGINQTSGLTRLNGLNSITTIFAAANFSVDEAYLFLNNTDATKGNQVTLTLGSQKTAVLQGGDSVLMAIDPSALDIKLTADQASTTVEYQLFHNG
tara:strand:- start:22291 stop:22677 length:387 start_codon:yes stop_codon:yes gene_type:complete